MEEFKNIRNLIKKQVKSKLPNVKLKIKTNKFKTGIYYNISVFGVYNSNPQIQINDLKIIENIVNSHNIIELKENYKKSKFQFNIEMINEK